MNALTSSLLAFTVLGAAALAQQKKAPESAEKAPAAPATQKGWEGEREGQAPISRTPAAKPAGTDPLSKAESKWVYFGPAVLHYKSLATGGAAAGADASGVAVVFVHGFACDLTFWREQVKALNGKARMILVDLPGHGESDKPDRPYNMEVFARAIDHTLRAEKVKKAVLVGHSMGTPVIRQYYRLFPDRVLGLVAVDGSFKPFFTDKAKANEFLDSYRSPKYKEYIAGFLGTMLDPKSPAELKADLTARMTSIPQHVAVKSMESMNLDDAIWTDDPIKVPLLCVMAKSPMWGPEYVAFVKKLAPSVDYREVEGAGHFFQLEKPQALNQPLLAFLKKLKLAK